jgi:RNA polymerase sigma factor (TIGR02999 family)
MPDPGDHGPPPSRDDEPVLEGRALAAIVYDELRGLAAGYMRGQRRDHTLQPTALVNEAFLKIVKANPAAATSRSHFLAVAATAMRQVLINHAEARGARKRGGGRRRVELLESLGAPDRALSLPDLLAIDESLRRLEALDRRKASVVEMKLFGNLTTEETAEVLGVSVSTVESDWRMARAWLSRELGDGEGKPA